MLVKCKQWWTVLAIALIAAASKLKQCHGGGRRYPQVPCYFIFGDSLADNGNNNFLKTLAKVDYAPYGMDFPLGPTGRFSNGRTVFDVIGELLGFPDYIPPFATASTTDLIFGVNYASGSAGIRDETGQQSGERISFDAQLFNHKTTILRLFRVLGSKELTMQHLHKCFYAVGLGNNDYLNNYFLPTYYNTSKEYTLEKFTDILIHQYKKQIMKLYRYGARKIALFGVGVLGCTPGGIKLYGYSTDDTGCVAIMNNASELFNHELISVVEQFNADLTDAKFIYINSFGIGKASSVLDFKVNNSECCPVNELGQCVADQTPCKNRSAYAFWDYFHPTEILNAFTAQISYSTSDPSYAYPFDIRHLVTLAHNEGRALAN